MASCTASSTSGRAEMTKRVSQTVSRPIRTLVQFSPAYAIMAVVQSFHHFNPEQFGALLTLLGLVFGWAQVVLENMGYIRAFMRAVPPKTDPIVAEELPVKTTTKRAKKTTGFALLALIGAILLVIGAIW